jgi:low temperature requirement protein LtrA
VGLLPGPLDAVHIGRVLLVFWLVWWAWTQFTWALNAADTTHEFVELATMLAAGIAFFMAVTLPDAFGDGALLFAVPYVLVRTIEPVGHDSRQPAFSP